MVFFTRVLQANWFADALENTTTVDPEGNVRQWLHSLASGLYPTDLFNTLLNKIHYLITMEALQRVGFVVEKKQRSLHIGDDMVGSLKIFTKHKAAAVAN